ncbi:MAG: hypothetical protein JWP65_1727 [Ramlibacter sp.]|jgi:hypothetical protein|uniref:hypothetical protein n=1 Tax=Ramlibacter sp. TaxID=1917967 RepID=UPI0026085FD7|nr:hypothetical protein [Ramlibacter sp.]MDB5751306.1 hypothetical protein [Ramlibacter sp.]
MTPSTFPAFRHVRLLGLLLAASTLGGCAVVTVAGAAVSVAATGAALAVDAAVGTVKLTGAAVGAVLPDGD